MSDDYDSLDDLSLAAAESFCDLANETIQRNGVFRVTLSGGSTPKRLYELLAQRDLPWQNIQWFWGDERNVLPDHAESNFKMVREALLDHLPQESVHAFPVPVNPDSPSDTAKAYESTLREVFKEMTFPRWDLALLGMGDDAHTASLFPETKAIARTDRWFVENWVPKLDTFRYTLTAPAINSASERWFLIAGANKREALANVWSTKSGHPPQVSQYPSQLINSPRWFVTRDALPV